jgi:hypothetical protein
LSRRASPIPAGTIAALADDDADGAVKATRLWPREPQVKRGPVRWSEPARLLAAEERLIVPIEGNQSCRGTISQPAIQARSNVVTHQRLPHTALAFAGAVRTIEALRSLKVKSAYLDGEL